LTHDKRFLFFNKKQNCAGKPRKSRLSIHIKGPEECAQWSKIFSSPDEDLNLQTVEKGVVRIARSMMETADIGAFIFECTDIPPFAHAVRKATNRPVLDFVTLINHVYQAIKSCLSSSAEGSFTY